MRQPAPAAGLVREIVEDPDLARQLDREHRVRKAARRVLEHDQAELARWRSRAGASETYFAIA